MNYAETREFISEREKLGSVFGLDSIRELLRRLGSPEKDIPAVHIAGTNGKGSIMSYVEGALISSGFNVGRYISPTIFDYRERWQLNKKWASEEDVAWAVSKVKEADGAMENQCGLKATAFEIETAAAFLMFNKWQVDIILVECGMGGRLDATNVLEKDTLNILASISFDHMQVLGDSLEAITREKLGIVRKGSELVSYPQPEEAENEIDEYCRNNDVKLIKADVDKLEIIDTDVHGSEFIYKGKEYHISIGGYYQILNCITAIEALEVLASKYEKSIGGKYISETAISEGLESTSWPGRFTVIGSNPSIIVDGAHNDDAWHELRRSLDKYFTNDKIIYIIGVLADKEYKKMVRILGPDAYRVYAVESDSPRALKKCELSEEFRSAGVNTTECDGVRDALRLAKKEALKMLKEKDEASVIVVCGTLTIVGEALKLLNDGEI